MLRVKRMKNNISQGLILMFRMITSLSILVVRRLSFLFPFLSFMAAFIYGLNEFACLCQYTLALCSQPPGITR